VTRFDYLSDAEIAMLQELRDDGHAIEAHGLRHLDAPDYRERHGLRAYLDDELLPSLELMRDAGFEPRSFAYPFGARTSELDRAVLDHFELLRSVTFTESYPGVFDPCPE
jgi:peptidoglycan/xylan/chitin deacetylase (PgdA/CDA1 family)